MATTSSTAPLAPPPFDSPTISRHYHLRRHPPLRRKGVPHLRLHFLRQPSSDSSIDETYGNLPVYRSSEDCHTMCAGVRLCYPMAIEFETMVEIAVLDALQKYMMEDAQERLKEDIGFSEMMKTEPIKIYAIACRYRWATIARAAAREILRIPLFDWKNSTELRSITLS